MNTYEYGRHPYNFDFPFGGLGYAGAHLPVQVQAFESFVACTYSPVPL